MTATKGERTRYTTDNEISYIRKMGRFYPIDCSRGVLLQRYKEASLNRADWGGMDLGKIIKALDKEIILASRLGDEKH